jgi:hypothetical protein
LRSRSPTSSPSTDLESLQAKNARAPLEGDEATAFQEAAQCIGLCRRLHASPPTCATDRLDGEAPNDVAEPDFLFDTPQDAVKSMVAGLDRALPARRTTPTSPGADALWPRGHRRTADAQDPFRRPRRVRERPYPHRRRRLHLDGFDVAPGKKSKPLVMTFKKPDEVVGNHIAKYQSVKLAKMLMAYDFDRQMNPFVELGGFLFTFIGDGAPGTGKTTLIQMIAGLVNGYCQVAGYPSTTRISASTRSRPIRASPARTANSSSTMC